MSIIIKSFSVGNGDMFYIKHGSSNFTIIDCNIDSSNSNQIISEIKNECSQKNIIRFISTHPDEDHFHGITKLFDEVNIPNFYCVKNNATKEDKTNDFLTYCKLRDSAKAFYIYKDCSRKWMNRSDETNGSSGIEILWPNIDNEVYKKALEKAEQGESPNNISPIIKYSLQNGVTVLWFGDLETSFMEEISTNISLPKADIIFAPHHGRDSGTLPKKWLESISPKVIIIGEAPSEKINYLQSYNTITQNSAKDITLSCTDGYVDIYVSSENYSVNFLMNRLKEDPKKGYYIGSLVL